MTSRCEATTRTMPGAAVIELTGEVDGTAADVLTAAYQAAVTGTDVGIVVLDFASVVYINSTGIALIVSILARALPRDLRYHQAVGFHRALSRPRSRRQPANRTCCLTGPTAARNSPDTSLHGTKGPL